MSKNKKILLGIATFWPIVYILLIFFVIFSMLFYITTQPPNWFLFIFPLISRLHFFTLVESLALIAYYIYHVFNNKNVKKDKKTLWTVVIFIGNYIAMPIYWYNYIWKK